MEIQKQVQSFRETLALSTKGVLKDKTRMAIRYSKVYHEDFAAPAKLYGPEGKALAKQSPYLFTGPTRRPIMHWHGQVLVEPSSTLNAARRYRDEERVAVLSFAHPTIPAGGTTGSMATQEGYLCQCTNLYPCLTSQPISDLYYGYNKTLGHPFGSDRLIYSRDITVFKDSSLRVLDPSAWFDVDIITCSAPLLTKGQINRKELILRLKKRMANILEAAAANGVQVLILGAFGCGASKNPPEVVASAFYEAIEEGLFVARFQKIVFAIKGAPENLLAFQAAFSTEPLPPPQPAALHRLPKISI